MTFTVEGATAPQIRTRLAEDNINVSITSLSSTRIDMQRRGIDSMIRASVHYYNSEEEVDRLVEIVAEM